MKEKRYFCDWWDNMKYGEKWKFYLAMTIIAIAVASASMLFFGNISVFDYPEDTYKNLEEAYLPYVHEEVGIDIIGLKEAVNGLKDPIISEGKIQITYGYTEKYVTITLDKNYKTISIKRNTNTASEYTKNAIKENITSILAFTILLFAIELAIGVIIHFMSYTHKSFDEFLAKKRKNKS